MMVRAVDLALFDTAGGYWYIWSLERGLIQWQLQWGWSTAVPVSGDFNGDGRYDLALFDTVTTSWYIWSLDSGLVAWALQWGMPGGMPIGAAR